MKKSIVAALLVVLSLCVVSCGKENQKPSESSFKMDKEISEPDNVIEEPEREEPEVEVVPEVNPEAEEETESEIECEVTPTEEPEDDLKEEIDPVSVVCWDESWQYADHSVLHADPVTIYRATTEERKEVVVTVNAGHGTSGGSSVKTLCHPDGSPKVTGGSTGEGATKATAVASGTTMLDGTAESKVTLSLAMIVKETLLRNGYDVLMIRETDDAQIDNVARTVYANNCSDCHIALHYNSTTNDAGLFYLGVPDIASYKQMEPVASHWEEHNEFGAALLEGAKAEGVKIFGSGFMGMDLTQTSYSTVPSTDLEVGDRGSDYSPEAQQKIADGILAGLDIWMKQNAAKE